MDREVGFLFSRECGERRELERAQNIRSALRVPGAGTATSVGFSLYTGQGPWEVLRR